MRTLLTRRRRSHGIAFVLRFSFSCRLGTRGQCDTRRRYEGEVLVEHTQSGDDTRTRTEKKLLEEKEKTLG